LLCARPELSGSVASVVFRSETPATTASYALSLHDALPIFSDREAHLDDCVVVEMDAYEADDKDEDAEHGAVLVWPQRIVSVTQSDRKSTRLNFSHVKISYAVFCLKKKTNSHPHTTTRTSVR